MWTNTLVVACIFVFVIWLVISLQVYLALKRNGSLARMDAGSGKPGALSVIIPARNEEGDIADALASILDQQGVDLEVIVVNDHSRDSTGTIIDELSRKDPRVKAIHNPPLSNGWMGKCNAMQHGALSARNSYLLFTDADIIFQPYCFQSAQFLMARDSIDFLSLGPRFIVKPFWENINIPMYFFGMARLFSSAKFQDPDAPDARAAGAFMLMRRSVFDQIGGLDSIRAEMADDVALARRIKSRGFRCDFRFAPDLLRVSMFKDNLDAFLGPTKNILMAVEGQIWAAVPLILLTVALFWTPPAAVLYGIKQTAWLPILAGSLLYTCQYASLFMIRPIMNFQPLKVLFFSTGGDKRFLLHSACIILPQV